LRPAIISITGLGLCTALGDSPRATWEALLAGRFISDHARAVGSFESPRVCALACRAAEQAVNDAGWNGAELAETALVVGTSKGPIEAWLDGPTELLPSGLSEVARCIAAKLGLAGAPRLTISTACASGLHALIRGVMLLGEGHNRVLVVAAESSLHPLFLASFGRLGVLADPKIGCRPFDQNRAGFLVSEAAAAVCISTAPSVPFTPSPGTPAEGGGGGLLRGPGKDPHPKPPLFEPEPQSRRPEYQGRGIRSGGGVCIERFALAADAAHLTGGDPSGRMTRRLLASVLDGHEVDLIHAHGTGTDANDQTELAAIQSVIGDTHPSIYSHKGALGHSLGAAGLIAVVLNCLCHADGRIPGNVRSTHPLEMGSAQLSTEPTARPVNRSVVIASGFGGAGAAVTLKIKED
jgi:3-oxoacyl-[acyl-carrier-protein] synthase II